MSDQNNSNKEPSLSNLQGAIVVILGMTVFIWAIASMGNNSDKQPNNTESQEETENRWTKDDVEYQLTVIEKGGAVDYDDERIDEYASLLDSAEPKCEEDREMIADMAVRSVQILEEENINVTPYKMIEEIVLAVPEDLEPMECSEVLSSVMVLMREGVGQ